MLTADRQKSMIRWRLAELMARYGITGKALAEELGIREASVTNLKKSKTMPRIDGERLEELCKALGKLSGVTVSFADLLEENDD